MDWVVLHMKCVAEAVNAKLHDFLHVRSYSACVYVYNKIVS